MPNYTQGPLFPTVGASIARGGRAWANPGNITLDDGAVSDCTLQGTDGGDDSDILRGTGFGFSIPTNSTINGILLEIKRSAVAGTNALDEVVSLLKAGVEVGTNKALGANWPNVLTYVSYGGALDTFGVSWLPADINASNFGADLVVHDDNASGVRHADVDAFRITVYYFIPTSFVGVNLTDA